MKFLVLFKISIVVFSLALISCDDKRVFEENNDFAGKVWYVDSLQVFKFKVEDISKPYNLLVNVRNSENYPYYNLFIRYYLQDSTGQEIKSQQTELILMEPTTGKPLGDGLGDVYSHKFEILKNFSFPKTGTYIIKLKQYMRQDPLPEIYSVGFRLENVSKNKD
ncbi:MAG: gliding motility lipoprotein GldH [Opitutaceae bacterium]|nr:gliding motility lipoprotein GldH [Cytophagales bacterium]